MGNSGLRRRKSSITSRLTSGAIDTQDDLLSDDTAHTCITFWLQQRVGKSWTIVSKVFYQSSQCVGWTGKAWKLHIVEVLDERCFHFISFSENILGVTLSVEKGHHITPLDTH